MSSTMVTSSTQTLRKARARPGARGRQLGFGSGHVAEARYAALTPRRAGCGFRFGPNFTCAPASARGCAAPGSRQPAVMRANLAPCSALPRRDPPEALSWSNRGDLPFLDPTWLAPLCCQRRRRFTVVGCCSAPRWVPGVLLSRPGISHSHRDDAMAAAELKRAAERADLCSASNATGSGLRGEYFAKEPLASTPLLVRVDTTIDFDATLDWPAQPRRSPAFGGALDRLGQAALSPAATASMSSSPRHACVVARQVLVDNGRPRERRSISTRDGSIRSMSTRAGSMRWSAG